MRFLRLLLRKVRGQLLVIWDGAPIHRGQPVKDFLRRGAPRRLHLEQLPAYAPELNPDEGIWSYLKRVELGNQCCHDLAELTTVLRWPKNICSTSAQLSMRISYRRATMFRSYSETVI